MPFSARDLGSNVSVWATPPTGHVCAALPATPCRSLASCRREGSSLRATVCGSVCTTGGARCLAGARVACAGERGEDRRARVVRGGRQARARHAGGRQASRRSDSRGGRFALALGGGARGHHRKVAAFVAHSLFLACFFFSLPLLLSRRRPLSAVRVRQSGIREIGCAATYSRIVSLDADITLHFILQYDSIILAYSCLLLDPAASSLLLMSPRPFCLNGVSTRPRGRTTTSNNSQSNSKSSQRFIF